MFDANIIRKFDVKNSRQCSEEIIPHILCIYVTFKLQMYLLNNNSMKGIKEMPQGLS